MAFLEAAFTKLSILAALPVVGENGAIIWALLWAINLSDEIWLQQGRADISFTFNFDDH